MRLYKLIMTNNACYKTGKRINPIGIVVHSTGANNPRISRYVGPDDGRLGHNVYGNHWNNPNMTRRVCVHAFIGKLADGSIATYQTLPWDYEAWHVAGAANKTHISFEICEDGLKDPIYFDKVYREAVELCAHLCGLYPSITLNNIIGHYEAYQRGIGNNHGDPRHWFSRFGKSMDTFRADVAKELAGTAPPSQDSMVKGHKVKVKLTREENLAFFQQPIGYIAELDIEDYLLGVVPAEVGNCHLEAAKAQAIAARSIVYYWTKDGKVIDDTTQYQAYRAPLGLDPRFGNAHSAVKETAGQILTFEGKVAQAYYADSNGGKVVAAHEYWTQGGKAKPIPYLVTKMDEWTKKSGKPYNGHPVGMSQQGAIWAANNGKTHQEILAFYYPNTIISPATAPTPVLPNPEPADPVVYSHKAKVATKNPLSLNLWQDTSKKVSLGKIPNSSTVFVLEELGSTWVRATFRGIAGYVDRQYLIEEKKPAPTPEPEPTKPLYQASVITRQPLSLNIWTDVNKGKSLTLVPRGAIVNVMSEYNKNWARVEYRGISGYVDRQYLKAQTNSPAPGTYFAEVVTRQPLSLNLWKEPRKGVSLERIPRGAIVEVLLERDKTWAKVKYNNTVGYVDRQYLKKK